MKVIENATFINLWKLSLRLKPLQRFSQVKGRREKYVKVTENATFINIWKLSSRSDNHFSMWKLISSVLFGPMLCRRPYGFTMATHLPIHLSVFLSICLPIHLSVLSIHKVIIVISLCEESRNQDSFLVGIVMVAQLCWGMCKISNYVHIFPDGFWGIANSLEWKVGAFQQREEFKLPNAVFYSQPSKFSIRLSSVSSKVMKDQVTLN